MNDYITASLICGSAKVTSKISLEIMYLKKGKCDKFFSHLSVIFYFVNTGIFFKLLVINLLKPTGHVMHQQFNVQQLYILPTLYLCVLYLSENKQRLVPLTA